MLTLLEITDIMETLLVHPENKDQMKALKAVMKTLKIKFEPFEGNYSYRPEFVAKMEREEKEFFEGDYTTITLDDIWKYKRLK